MLVVVVVEDEAVESAVRTAITALDHDGVEVDFADDFGLEGEIDSSVGVADRPMTESVSRSIRKLNGGEQMELSVHPEAIFVVGVLVLDLVVGEVKAEQCAILAIAAACGPLPCHGVGIVAFVDVDQTVGAVFGEVDLLLAEVQGALGGSDALVRIKRTSLIKRQADDDGFGVFERFKASELP